MTNIFMVLYVCALSISGPGWTLCTEEKEVSKFYSVEDCYTEVDAMKKQDPSVIASCSLVIQVETYAER
jgi:hypothetical protein